MGVCDDAYVVRLEADVLMSILKEIMALYRVKEMGQGIVKEAKKMDGVKPGWKTTEFWVKIVTIDLPMIWGVIHSFVPPSLAVEVELGATAIYTIGRVIIKATNDIKSAKSGTLTSVSTTTVAAS